MRCKARYKQIPNYCLEGGISLTICAAGKYSLTSASTCASCTSGKYQPTSGQNACIDCSAGYYCSDVLSQTACTAGKYSPTIGATSSSTCLSCNYAQGLWSTAGSSQCTGITCTSPAFTGTAGACTCAAGYRGTATYSSSGGLSGCNFCSLGTWAIAGNGLLCTGIYCTAPAYTGTAGACGCSAGYGGTISYSNGSPIGCTVCPTGYWATSGSGKFCAPVTCTSPSFTGAAGACVCSAGYYGSVTYTAGVIGGCSPCPG